LGSFSQGVPYHHSINLDLKTVHGSTLTEQIIASCEDCCPLQSTYLGSERGN